MRANTLILATIAILAAGCTEESNRRPSTCVLPRLVEVERDDPNGPERLSYRCEDGKRIVFESADAMGDLAQKTTVDWYKARTDEFWTEFMKTAEQNRIERADNRELRDRLDGLQGERP